MKICIQVRGVDSDGTPIEVTYPAHGRADQVQTIEAWHVVGADQLYELAKKIQSLLARRAPRHIHHVEIKVARNQDPLSIAQETARILQELVEPKEPA